MSAGIYKIINKTNNKIYIGESLNIEERWNKHKENLKNNSHHSYKLQSDYNTYGIENFNFDIVECIEYDFKPLVNKFILLALEDRYIKQFNSVECGYNIENTLDLILKGKKPVFQEPLTESYRKLLLNIIHNININNGKYIKSRFDKYFIRIPIEWYDNLDITNEELTILMLMYKNYIEFGSVSICNIEMLCEYMYIDSNSNKRIISNIKNTISSLLEKRLITDLYNLHYENIIVDDIKNKNKFFYVKLPVPLEDSYFIIYEHELDMIFNYLKNSNLSKFNLIRYFMACRRVCSNKNNFGYLAQSKLKRLITDSRAIQKYNKVLQDDLHLIRYNNSYLTKDGKYHTTFIGLYDDEVNFNSQLKFEVDRQGLVYTDKINSNTKRSITQQINKKSFDF